MGAPQARMLGAVVQFLNPSARGVRPMNGVGGITSVSPCVSGEAFITSRCGGPVEVVRLTTLPAYNFEEE